jgi:hypothetical protein
MAKVGLAGGWGSVVGEETSTKAFKQSISEASSSLLFLSHSLTLLLLLILLVTF